MASVQKFKQTGIVNILRHNAREVLNPSNQDIDAGRSHENYSLLQDGRSAYTIYQERKSELYCHGRADVVTLAGWVVTAPQDLPLEQHKAFFEKTHEFLSNRYGAENTVQSIVHQDESGQPHLHYCFIPATADHRHGGEKICANDVLTRKELRDFHPSLQKSLRDAGINARVHTGVTGGMNRTVSELKQEREYKRDIERGVTF